MFTPRNDGPMSYSRGMSMETAPLAAAAARYAASASRSVRSRLRSRNSHRADASNASTTHIPTMGVNSEHREMVPLSLARIAF